MTLVRRALQTGLVLMAFLGSCSSAGVDEGDLAGYWRLETIEVGGEVTDVERGVNTARPAWVLIDGHLEGSGGCNDFRGYDAAWAMDDGRLVPGEIIFTAALCSIDGDTESAMVTESIMQSFLWGGREHGFEVGITAEGFMTWSLGATTLTFSPTDRLPQVPPALRPTGFGRLECSPGVMVRQVVPDTGIDGEQILRQAVPDVVAVESDPVDWFWWGSDSSGVVVAVVAKGDIVPVLYELFTCRDR